MAIDWAALGSAAKSAAASQAKSAAAQMGTAAIASGGGLLSQIFFGAKNWKRTKELNRQTFEYNKDLAEQAFRQNVQMWNAENAYNTPAAQMMRMRAAGLNPNLLYGNGQEASAGLAGDAPNLQYGEYNPKVSYFDTNGGFQGINAAMDMYTLNSQIDLLRSEANRNNVEAAYKGHMNEWLDILNNLGVENGKRDLLIKDMMYGYYGSLKDQVVENTRKIGLEADQVGIILKYADELEQLKVQTSAANLGEIYKKYSKYDAEIRQLEGLYQASMSQAFYFATAGDLNKQNASESVKRMERIDQDIKESESRIPLNEAERNSLKGEAIRRWISAVTGGIVNLGSAGGSMLGGAGSVIKAVSAVGAL